jgi:hypothetical protein
MDTQQPRIEDRVTRGDLVGAVIAGVICAAAVALAVTFASIGARPSEVTSVPMVVPPSSLTP